MTSSNEKFCSAPETQSLAVKPAAVVDTLLSPLLGVDGLVADSSAHGAESARLPSLETVQLDKRMTEEERAAMIRKRNAVYSKRKYYKKKKGVAMLTAQRHELQDQNVSLKQEHKRLQMLLLACQRKVQVIHTAEMMNVAALRHSTQFSSMTSAWGGHPLLTPRQQQQLSMSQALISPASLALTYAASTRMQPPPVTSSALLDAKLRNHAEDIALMRFLQRNPC